MTSHGKLQSILIQHLQKYGSVELMLPDGVVLEMGITQLNQEGDFVKTNDYCWIIASRDDRQVSLDSFNAGVRFPDENSILVYDESFVDADGEKVRRLDVI